MREKHLSKNENPIRPVSLGTFIFEFRTDGIGRLAAKCRGRVPDLRHGAHRLVGRDDPHVDRHDALDQRHFRASASPPPTITSSPACSIWERWESWLRWSNPKSRPAAWSTPPSIPPWVAVAPPSRSLTTTSQGGHRREKSAPQRADFADRPDRDRKGTRADRATNPPPSRGSMSSGSASYDLSNSLAFPAASIIHCSSTR